MQEIFVEKPYQFVPPLNHPMVARVIRDWELYRFHLRKHEGVVSGECRHVDRLKASIAAGHGILLTPNHSRTADPLALGWLAKDARVLFFAMASWHLFHQGWLTRWAIRVMGAFSVNREAIDRPSIDSAIRFLDEAQRPLVIFPEGTTSRTNDRLMPMLDGIAFIARSAARKREKRGAGKTVIHPVAMKYIFEGDIHESCEPVLQEIERRLSWKPQSRKPMLERIANLGNALLTLKELEYLGEPQKGTLVERQNSLIDQLLNPLEQEWLGGSREKGIIARIKNLRMKILPELARQEVSSEERERRMEHFERTYLAQQIYCYPPEYLSNSPTVERVLETIERFEEDLNDKARVHGSFRVIIEVGEAIEVPTQRDRGADRDPLMVELHDKMQGMLDALSSECRKFVDRT
jgi:Acyltransferase